MSHYIIGGGLYKEKESLYTSIDLRNNPNDCDNCFAGLEEQIENLMIKKT